MLDNIWTYADLPEMTLTCWDHLILIIDM